jgi:uncharacterized damage-inducible protein DinB
MSDSTFDASAHTGAAALAAVLRLNTRLFLNCLVDVTEAHAVERPNGRTNSMSFIACHVVDSRYFLARTLGLDEQNPLDRFTSDVTGIEQMAEMPDLAAIRQAWRAIARTLEECVVGLTEAELRAPSAQRFPVDQHNVIGGIGFLLQHESYHLGQLALLRKFHGYPAMRYG